MIDEVNNYFTEAAPNKTKWRLDTEFKCTGFMKLMIDLDAYS